MTACRPRSRDLAELVRALPRCPSPGTRWSGAACAGASPGGCRGLHAVRIGAASTGPAWRSTTGPTGTSTPSSGPSARSRRAGCRPAPPWWSPPGSVPRASASPPSWVVAGPSRIAVPLAVLVVAYDAVGEGHCGRAARDGLDARARRAARRGRGLAGAAPGSRPLRVAVAHRRASRCSAVARCTAPRRRPRLRRWLTAGTLAVGAPAAATLQRSTTASGRRCLAGRVRPVRGVRRCRRRAPGARVRGARRPRRVRAATGAGIGGLTLLQAAWLARSAGWTPAAAIVVADSAGPLPCAAPPEPDVSARHERCGSATAPTASPATGSATRARSSPSSATTGVALTLDQPHLDPFADDAAAPGRARRRSRSPPTVSAVGHRDGLALRARPVAQARADPGQRRGPRARGSSCCPARCASPPSSAPRRCRAGPASCPRACSAERPAGAG